MTTTAVFGTTYRPPTDANRQAISDLRTFTHGLNTVVGARLLTRTGLPEYNMSTPDRAIQILIVPHTTAARPGATDRLAPIHTIRAVPSALSVKDTRRVMRKAHRQGEGTCLIVDLTTPISNIIQQLHLSHEYAVIPWPALTLDRFTLGIVRTAYENASTLIADQISGIRQAKEAVMAGVQLGILAG